MIEWTPLLLTFKLALITTFILLVVSIPLAYWLAFTKTKVKPLAETIVSMPLVLPPTVLGFYLLVAMSPNHAFGQSVEALLGIRLVFSFEGLVLGSIIYSLPFMVYPMQAGFTNLPPSLTEAAFVLGKSKWTTLFRVQLPNMKPSLIAGIVLTFAHTIGEFGVVLMIGGNIPGITKVASIAIYDEVESMNYKLAHAYSLVLFVVTFTILLLAYLVSGRYLKKIWL
ncbi:MAG: hypothetical protein RI973_1543 [Bacteroidota bacterium]|jgi:molybdate transport system permease protein